MSEETPMNLDLNLGPVSETGSEFVPAGAVSLEELIDDPMERFREVVRVRTRQRWRWRQHQMFNESPSLSVDLNQLIGDPGHATTLQAGEGSLAAEDRSDEPPKMCDTNNGFLQDEKTEKGCEVEKGSSNDGSLFDCNICFDLATEPVVTCCGHLFCWPCLYQWLHVHSDAKECPVCKGEVALKNLIPIYGRGSIPKEVKDPNLHIPVRPRARRVESLRQTIQRNPFSFPMEEMIRRIGRRFDLSRDISSPPESTGARETVDGTSAFINRIMTLRGIRSETPDDVVDLAEAVPVNSQTSNGHRLQTLYVRRPQSNFSRSPTPPSLLSSYNSAERLTAERLVDAYLGFHPSARSHEPPPPPPPPPPPVDDRDSFSSVAAVINSESQVDAAVEIDSVVSLSTSSSRRRIEPSRLADLDTGDSRAPRRRRLT